MKASSCCLASEALKWQRQACRKLPECAVLAGCMGPGVFGVMSEQFVVMSAHVAWC